MTAVICPVCQTPLPNDAPLGLCPCCLIGTAPPRPAAASSPALTPEGPRLIGDYELLEDGRAGGMGIVYRARQRSLNRIVALKMIRFSHQPTRSDLERFRIEAEAIAALKHENIVKIHEFGEHKGQPHFSMEFVEGGDLRKEIHKQDGRPFPLRRAAELVAAIARAVHHAHERGILHRDLKPGNILLDPTGKPCVTDFGLARMLRRHADPAATLASGSTPERPDLTERGQGMGSPGYTSPEQAEGRLEELTTASDVFSLGAILYHLITGQAPLPTKSWRTPEVWEEYIRLARAGKFTKPSVLNPRAGADVQTGQPLNDPDPCPRRILVRSGQQGIAMPGKPIEVRAVIPAQKIVQWWIYYPGILDPDELGLTPAEQAQLAASLTAYRDGDLPEALRQYPGYPEPTEPAREAQRIYLAGILLSVGAVDRAEAQLSQVNSNAPLARALCTMIAAVAPPLRNLIATNGPLTRPAGTLSPSEGERDGVRGYIPNPQESTLNPQLTSSELLALSYAHQATNNLKAALAAARAAVSPSPLNGERAGVRGATVPHESEALADEPSAPRPFTRNPNFAFGWARVAELEFSFGHTRAAQKAVERALALAPRNAQAHALKGFLLAAENKLREAIAEFDRAIEMDPALGNAWLGRGLCRIRQAGVLHSPFYMPRAALDDLQTATILEPNRSLLRSYAGKAFSDAGDARLANKEFDYARKLDPNDPTPWLYSALEKWQENRANEAVRELERSVELNDNRALFRSRLLLDQDLAVRSASLAKMYQSVGLEEIALSEAAQAVRYDYTSYSAHEFMAESFNALRDPTRFNLRYETVWFNELLLANTRTRDLVSPKAALTWDVSQGVTIRGIYAQSLGGVTFDESVRLADPTGGLQPGVPNRDLRG